jgi:hypothetical protein
MLADAEGAFAAPAWVATLLDEPLAAARPTSSRSQARQGGGIGDRASAATECGAHAIGTRRDPDATEIESIRVPAGHDRRLALGAPITVQTHGFAELLEGHRRETSQNAVLAQSHGEVGRAVAVAGIGPLIHALAVVEECEPGQDPRIDIENAREVATVPPHPTPVCDAMDSMMEVEAELRLHDRECSMEDVVAGGIHWLVR